MGCLAGWALLFLLLLVVVADRATPTQFVLLVIGLVGLAVWWSLSTRRRSPAAIKKRLLAKYGSEQLVLDIMQHRCWIGQSKEQLLDALGYPRAKDVKQTARIRRETWHYADLTVTLEDEVVSAWESHETYQRPAH
jgi:hypothetical protein